MKDRTLIRPIVRADLPTLKRVIASTDLFPPNMLEGMVEGYLNGASDAVVWLTFANPDPAAIAYAAPEPMTEGCWNLYLIAVHSDHHGQGIGQALMRYVEEALAVEGVRVLLVETSGLPEMARTRLFYSQCGYEEEARIRDFYQDGDDKIVFRKAL